MSNHKPPSVHPILELKYTQSQPDEDKKLTLRTLEDKPPHWNVPNIPVIKSLVCT